MLSKEQRLMYTPVCAPTWKPTPASTPELLFLPSLCSVLWLASSTMFCAASRLRVLPALSVAPVAWMSPPVAVRLTLRPPLMVRHWAVLSLPLLESLLLAKPMLST